MFARSYSCLHSLSKRIPWSLLQLSSVLVLSGLVVIVLIYLFVHLFSSLPVPLPVNIRSLNHLLFSSLPIPFSDNICITVCYLFSSLPDPFPDNSVLLFVLICLVLTNACPRLRLQPNPLVPPPCDSRLRPTPVFWTCLWNYLGYNCLPTYDSGLLFIP